MRVCFSLCVRHFTLRSFVAATTNSNERERKDASRQTTLFGLPPGPGPEKKARTRPLKDKRDGVADVALTQSHSKQINKESTIEQSDTVELQSMV